MRKIWNTIMRFLSVFVMLACVAFADASEITVVTENFPPYNYLENGSLAGISTEVVRAVMKQADMDAEIAVYPWARAYRMALEEKNTLIYSIGRIPEREKLFRWVGVVAPLDIHLYKLRKRGDIRLEKLEDAKRYDLGILRQDMCQQYLENKGFVIKTITNTDEQSIRMLMRERVDLIPFDELAFVHKIRELGFSSSNFEKAYFLKDLSAGLYMAFSRGTSEHLAERFRKALEQIKADGIYDRIIGKHRLSEK